MKQQVNGIIQTEMTTGYIQFSFDQLGIPANATIESINVTPIYSAAHSTSVVAIYSAQVLQTQLLITIYGRFFNGNSIALLDFANVFYDIIYSTK